MFKNKLFSSAKADVVFVYAAYSLRYVYLLLLIPFYARVLGVEGYGVILAALSLMQMLWIFTSWGFAVAGGREIALAKPNQYPKIFGVHVSARLILGVVALAVGLVAIQFSSILKLHQGVGLCAIMLGIISAFNLGWYFTGIGKPRDAVKLEVLGFIISLALIFSFVRKEDDTLIAIASLLISGTIALIMAYWWVRRQVTGFTQSLSLKQGLVFISNTKSMFIYSSSSMLLGASSTYLLSTLSTPNEVGYFGSAERLVSAGLSLMGPIGAVFIPKVTVLFNENQTLAYAYVKRLLLFLFSIGLAGLLISVFAGQEIIHLIFGKNFEGSVTILKCLAFVFPLSAITLILSAYVLIPLHKERLLAKVTIFGAVINVLCAFPLASWYGGFGMALARVLSEATILTCLLIYCKKNGILDNLFKAKNQGAKL